MQSSAHVPSGLAVAREPEGARSRAVAPRLLSIGRAVDRIVGTATDLGAVLVLVGIVGLISVEVVARKWFGWSFSGVEELAKLLLVWGTFLYFGRAYRAGVYIRLQAVYARLPFTGRLGVELIERGLALAFAGVLGWQGYQWTKFQFEIGRTSFTSLALPAWIVNLAIPVGCLLFALAILTRPPARDARGEGLEVSEE